MIAFALAALVVTSGGTFSNCVVSLDTVTQTTQLFTNFNDAEDVCINGLNAVNDANATCTVRQKVVNGQRKFFPDFQIHEQINAASAVDAINQLQQLFQQGTNLFADAALQTVLTNNGQCK